MDAIYLPRSANILTVSYYLSPILESVGVTDPVSQAMINLGLQIWNAILALVGATAAERYGRRPLWLNDQREIASSQSQTPTPGLLGA